MRITLAPMIVIFAATLLHAPLCYFFMYTLDMGIIGVSLALVIKDFVLFVSITIYGSCSTVIKARLVPIDMEAFRGWGPYLKVSLPATVMICSATWAEEVIVIVAGNIGVDELASQVICM